MELLVQRELLAGSSETKQVHFIGDETSRKIQTEGLRQKIQAAVDKKNSSAQASANQ
jgi:hypothetical protein